MSEKETGKDAALFEGGPKATGTRIPGCFDFQFPDERRFVESTVTEDTHKTSTEIKPDGDFSCSQRQIVGDAVTPPLIVPNAAAADIYYYDNISDAEPTLTGKFKLGASKGVPVNDTIVRKISFKYEGVVAP